MLAQTIDLEQEWNMFKNSHPTPSNLNIRDIYWNGAFSIYKMIVTAEDDQNKLREVMFKLGEQFRKEYAGNK